MADLYYIEEDYYSPSLGYFVYTADASVSIQTTVTTLCSADKIKDTASNLTCAVTTLCSADKIIGAASSLTSSATLNCLTGVIRNAVISPVSLFSTSMTISVTSSRSIDCSVAVTLACGATVNRSTAVSLSTIVSLSLQADRTRGLTSSITTTVTQSTSAAVTRTASVTSSNQFTQTTAVTRIRSGSQTTTASFTQTTANSRVRFALATPSAVFTQTTVASRRRASAVSLQAQTTLVCSALNLNLITANLSTSATLSCNFRLSTLGGRAVITSAATLNATAINLVGYGWGDIRSLLHFQDNLVDSVTTTTLTGSVSSYFNGATNFGRAALDPSNILADRTTGSGITTIGTQDFTYDVKLKAAANVGYPTGLYSGILARFRDADNTDYVYQLEYEESTGTTFNLKFVQDRISTSSRTTLVTNTFTASTDSGDIPYSVLKHIKLIRKSGVLYFYVDGVVRSNTVAFTSNLGSEVYVARQMFYPSGPLLFAGKLDESCLRIGGSYSTADFTPPVTPYGPASFAYAGLNSNFTSTVTGNHRVRLGVSNLIARATVNVTAIRLIGPIISIVACQATLTAAVRKNMKSTCSAQVVATTSTINTRLRRNIVYLNSTVTVTATAKKLIGIVANLNAPFTTNVTAKRLLSGQSNMVAFNTQTTAVVKNARGTITMESKATVNCLAIKTGEVVVQSQSNAIVTASFLKTPQPRLYSFALTTTATLTVTVSKISRSPIYLNTIATVQANVTYISVNTIPLSAIFTQSANVSAGKIVIVDMQTNFTSSVVIKKTMYGVIAMSAFNTLLSVGTKVTIDPWYQLVVPPETRLRKITQETGILVVDSENRVNIIKEEIRTITVPTETGVWHIPFSPLVGTRRIQ